LCVGRVFASCLCSAAPSAGPAIGYAGWFKLALFTAAELWDAWSPVKPLSQAQAEVETRSRPLPAEAAPLAEAGGRVLARAVAAASDLPGTDISMMDGYALRARDAAGPCAAGTWHRRGQVCYAP